MVIHGLDINLADVGKGRRLREAENAGEYHNRNGHRADAFAGHLTSVFVRRKSDYAFYRREAGRARLRVLLTLVMKQGLVDGAGVLAEWPSWSSTHAIFASVISLVR